MENLMMIFSVGIFAVLGAVMLFLLLILFWVKK
jgi:hypothetical protein